MAHYARSSSPRSTLPSLPNPLQHVLLGLQNLALMSQNVHRIGSFCLDIDASRMPKSARRRRAQAKPRDLERFVKILGGAN